MAPKGREPVWLTAEIVQALHDEQLEWFGGSAGMLKQGALLAVLARPLNQRAYDESADLATFAATYLAGLINAHIFVDGNKRVGLAAALVFLRLNDHALRVPPAELYALVLGIATSKIGETDAALWLRGRITPLDTEGPV